DLAAIEIDLLVLAADDDAFLQIEDAALAERRDRLAGLRAQFDESITDRVEDDAVVALAVGPVRESAARELARRDLCAQPLVRPVDPFQLAGPGVERNDRSPRAARRIENAADHDRRPFELVLRPRTEVVGLE